MSRWPSPCSSVFLYFVSSDGVIRPLALSYAVSGLGAEFAVQPAPCLGAFLAGVAGPLLHLVLRGPCFGSGARGCGDLRGARHLRRRPALQSSVRCFGKSVDVQGLILFNYPADVSGRWWRKAPLITRFFCWFAGRCWSIEDARADAVESPNIGASSTLAAISTWDER